MFAKKSLGQNFLKSKAALRAMIEAGNVQAGDLVLEVGPGKGALTSALLEAGATVVALEKDSRLIVPLQEKYQKEIADNKLRIIAADALEFDPSTILSEKNQTYKIIANIPYYITGQFFRTYLTHKKQPEKMVIMVQKEVAERIATRDNKESLLSLSIKCYGTPKYIMTVQKKYFSPEPNVDSAIILIDNISRNFFDEAIDGVSEEKYFELIKAGFAHKRKVLISNLANILPREKLEEVFKKINISEKIRAEDTTISNWKSITKELFEKTN